ncbi:LysR family transcriptional regulator [Clostridioides difficile]|nr:LysR family transcriptional regulator [Clostridioides difficile]
MELKYLYTVKKILEAGSFQKAAQKLNYTQSTITFQIQQLEKELSIKLFEKIGRKMVLTQAGKDILPYIDTIILSSEQILNYGKNTSEMVGTLNIAMTESLLTYKMQPVLKTFREQAPNVQLSLQSLNCYEIIDRIISGEADIGIHYDIGKYAPTILTEPLVPFNMCLIAAPNLSTEHIDFLSENQHKTISLITSEPNSIYQQLFDLYLKSKNIVLDNTIELWSIEAIKKSVMSNLGIAFLPHFTVEEELAEGKLQELNTDLKTEKINAICTYHKNKWISSSMELFIRLLKNSISD